MNSIESNGRRSRSRWRDPAPSIVAAVAAVFAVLVVVRILSGEGWDITYMAAFGVESEDNLDFAEGLLGEVSPREEKGHDGRFFFVQAMDPLHLSPQDNAAVLDRPTYRAQRMLFPLLAGGFGLFPPHLVAWAMVVVNLLALAAGTLGAAVFAQREGWSSWWGLAFGLNLGIISELSIGGAGVLAFACAMWALVAIQRDLPWLAAGGFTLAVLSREVMALMVAGAALWLWRRHRRIDLRWTVTPIAAGLVWAGYVWWRLGDLPSQGRQVEELGWPLVGFVQAFDRWLQSPMDLVVGLIMMAILALFTLRTLASQRLIAWSVVGFVPVALLLSRQVWAGYFDITRALAPLLTGWVMLTFAHGVADPETPPVSNTRSARR